MPNCQIHRTFNTLLTPLTYNKFIKDDYNYNICNEFIELLISGITMNRTAIWPDIMEPASNPNHRSHFHSFAFLFYLFNVHKQACKELQLSRDRRKSVGSESISLQEILNIMVVSGCESMLLHLLLDAFTPRGLPLF